MHEIKFCSRYNKKYVLNLFKLNLIIYLMIILLSQITIATAPIINSVILPETINLNAGTTKEIECVANVTDIDNDLQSVNATIYDNTRAFSYSQDNNNSHYTNSSCIVRGNSPYNISCGFSIMYHANPTSWTCNITVNDGTQKVSMTNSTNIEELKAITVTGIEYHDGAHNSIDLGSNSQITMMNISNIGNINISIELSGTNISCDSGCINVSNQIYNLSSIFTTGTRLTNTPIDSMLNISKHISLISIEHIYWMLHVPSTSAGGNCSGTIKVDAV